MTEYFDAVSAKQRYELLDDAALVRIAYSSTAGYAQEAIALAREELLERGISSDHPAVISKQASDQAPTTDPRESPLPGALKALCFILTPIFALIVAVCYFTLGRSRAGKEALAWMFYGLLAWVALLVVLRSI